MPPLDIPDGDVYFDHHPTPMTHGGEVTGEFIALVTTPVDVSRARQPVTPGMPLMRHLALPAPDAYKILPSQASASKSDSSSQSIMGMSRISFPVARAPEFQRTPAVTVPEPPSAAPVPPAGSSSPAAAPNTSPATQNPAQTLTEAVGQKIDPVYPFLLYIALGFGTLYIYLDLAARYTILWAVLLIFGAVLTLLSSQDRQPSSPISSLGWGFSFGLVFSLPLLILMRAGLTELTRVLFSGVSPALLFQSLAIVGPISETIFFRGVIQDRRGLVASVIAAGLSSLLFYWPAGMIAPSYLVAAALFSTVLAGIYSFVRMRYGLYAACISQVTVNLLLLFVPSLLP